MPYYKRALEVRILSELAMRPAVFLNGPRQAGKTTLARRIAAHMQADYVTFDSATAQAAAARDPEGFLQSFDNPLVLDEVQLVPDIFRALKRKIDEGRNSKSTPDNGRYLLTGSANVMSVPALSDALVGRAAILSLYPLSAGEILGHGVPTINGLFDQELGFERIETKDRPANFAHVIARTSFPELVANPAIDRASWFESYISTLFQRDIRQIAEIEKASLLPLTLKVLAARAGGLLNDADAARDAAMNPMTYRRYRTLMQLVFLITPIPPWFRNIGKRLVKSPKLYFTDSALLCHVLGVDPATLKTRNPVLSGRVLENLVASELSKQLSLLTDGALHHFRTHDGKEVDFVIERRNGRLLGIEVKGSESVSDGDFEGLKVLREKAGKDFARGIVLYLGNETHAFGEDLMAMPLDTLWTLNMEITASTDIRAMGDAIAFWADYGSRTRIRCRIEKDLFPDLVSEESQVRAVKDRWQLIWPAFVKKIAEGRIDVLEAGRWDGIQGGGYRPLREVRLGLSDVNLPDFRRG